MCRILPGLGVTSWYGGSLSSSRGGRSGITATPPPPGPLPGPPTTTPTPGDPVSWVVGSSTFVPQQLPNVCTKQYR